MPFCLSIPAAIPSAHSEPNSTQPQKPQPCCWDRLLRRVGWHRASPMPAGQRTPSQASIPAVKTGVRVTSLRRPLSMPIPTEDQALYLGIGFSSLLDEGRIGPSSKGGAWCVINTCADKAVVSKQPKTQERLIQS